MGRQAAWSDEELDTIKKLWREGKTALEISYHLDGKSRSSVLAKARRLNLESRASHSNAKAVSIREGNDDIPVQPRPRRVYKPAAEREVIANTAFGEKCELNDLKSGECCWPVGDPQDKASFGFCGAPKQTPSKPYCAEHASIAYR